MTVVLSRMNIIYIGIFIYFHHCQKNCPYLSLGLVTQNIYHALAFWQSVAGAKSKARCEIGAKTERGGHRGGAPEAKEI